VWQAGNYFDIAEPTRIKIPNNRGGRYFIHAELQWEPKIGTEHFSDVQSTGGFVGAYIVRNGVTPTSTREAQSTAAVIAGSTLVTHNVILETQLGGGDFVELFAFQRVTGIDPIVEPFPIKVNATLTVRRLGSSA
jgi:hypothetical protein